MKSKQTTEESTDRGVSPVIGVILMVAITVILAAVIAAFVLDIGPGDTDPGASISVDVDSDENVDVELNSLQGNTDGVALVNDVNSDTGDLADEKLTVSGQTEQFDEDDVEGGFGDGTALIAYTSGEDDPDDISDLDNFAIIDNLDELAD